MSIEQDRLLALIEFAKQSARLRTAPAATVAAHKLFSLYEHQVQGYPGIHFNLDAQNDGDERWLVVDRLHESRPPESKSPLLKPWLELTQGPETEPRLKPAVSAAVLIAAGTHRSSAERPRTPEERAKPALDPTALVQLTDYDQATTVRTRFNAYLTNLWQPWAAEERKVRWTIKLYANLFTLKQTVDGSLVEAPVEVVWGVGMALWQNGGHSLSYPMVTRQVELSLHPLTAAIEVRPRDLDPRLETDWFAAVDNPGVAEVERIGKAFFANATTTFSPFDRGTFEPLLQAAVTHLDPGGEYWPNQVPAEDRTLPKADTKLKVTDTWVLFARPRTNSLFIADLENLKKKVEGTDAMVDLPAAVAAIVTDPETENPVVELPTFRGVSTSYDGSSAGGSTPQDLYFPKPFNEEQTRIVQLLEVSEGVVVQGPPGTGKTHTIANVICHYLANGKRVLVTSMKDPALAVLHGQLPEEIRPLAISLLTSEQEGMKQFEHAIHKIASEVQGLDRAATARAIRQLEETIDALHGKLARIDRTVGDWARRNLERVDLDGEQIEPQDAARQVMDGAGDYAWIPDRLEVGPEFAPQFDNEDIVRLREARRALGPDLGYLGYALPQLADFPDSRQLLQVHQDLSRFTLLTQQVDAGSVPPLADSSAETLSAAQALLDDIDQLKGLRDAVIAAHRPWTVGMRETLRAGSARDLIALLESLGTELLVAKEDRKAFLGRPVTMPAQAELDAGLVSAVENLARGKSAFGLAGMVGKSEQKKALAAIRVVGAAPASASDWSHVAHSIAHCQRLRELAVRWNALAPELKLDRVAGALPEHGLEAVQHFELYQEVKSVVFAEDRLSLGAAMVFPGWVGAREIAAHPQAVAELESALRHHLTKNRLANVWVMKEQFQKVLEGRGGPVVQRIRLFLTDTLGNPRVPDAGMQGQWSELMAELVRVLGLGAHLHSVAEITARIEASGGRELARALRKPLAEAVDTRLPDNWKQGWRLRRLATYVDAIDAQDELKKLQKERAGIENDLARAYQEVVVKRTWLKLTEKASPLIRAALQAYLNAIQKIGKGTGKRAVRYRQDARAASAQANPAVPCWIMPHYRVSESLPPELGCFDLVVIDEASQSDLTALPALLRARKVLIVGDDKQVSPEAVGMEEEKVRSLMSRFLGSQVLTYRPQMSPERSVYDLFKVVFARNAVMLKEHFRCVSPIIEYSKREFYNHELRPLRMPLASQRLDPPLIDVLVEDGYRDGDLNRAEARFIVDEIKTLAEDPRTAGRSIGVVSLLGDKQALAIWELLSEELDTEVLHRHQIACGDARTFQGKERSIMFLTMVAAPNNVGAPLSRDTFAQRFNVAASRAQDRMYLVRSVEPGQLSEADRLRRSLISHFATPFAQDEQRADDLRTLCESPFEREVYDELTARGYWVTPQVKVGQYRIDLVVEGHNDARLAIECDGDKYHGADKWVDDMQRQRVLERAGWVFWRCFASSFLKRRHAMLDDLIRTLEARGVEPVGAEGAPRSVHTELRRVSTSAGTTKGAEAAEEGTPAEELLEMADAAVATASESEPRASEMPFLRPVQATRPEDYRTLDGLMNAYGLKAHDLRSKGGNLWVYTTEDNHPVAQSLKALGFSFARGRGWWKR